jgi:hypothetical protein
MKVLPVLTFLAVASSSLLFAQQEEKPVPKDSVRLSISGCAKGRVFTVFRSPEHESRGTDLAEGRHLRLEGNKKALQDIKAHEGSMVEVSGLIKKADIQQAGIGVGSHVRIAPAMPSSAGGTAHDPGPQQAVIDVESWRLLNSSCPS